MIFRTVDENYILDAINQLKSGKASGPDRVSITIIKDVKDHIAIPLKIVFNDSVMNGVFPDTWKLARVTPIFKSGAKNDGNNYRPISVISIFCRMLERLVHDQLSDFLKMNKKLTFNQSAFQKLCSTITSLVSSTDHWYDNMDSRKIDLTLFLDLKKAFDTVDLSSVLMKKLCAHGIRGSAGDWFESYLKERKQYCAANGHQSNIKNITCGIPQGSCLGPLLLIIYLNDFEKCLEFSQASLYADHTQITTASDDVEKPVLDTQYELVNLSEWVRINKLSHNPAKTEYMTIGHPRRIKQLEISDVLLLRWSFIKIF